MNKKRLIIILAVVLIGAALLVVLAILPGRKKIGPTDTNIPAETNQSGQLIAPTLELLDEADKENLGLSSETEAQVLKRAADGTVLIYQVINK